MKRCVMVLFAVITASSLAFAGGGGQSAAAKQTWETVRLNQSDQPWLVPYDQPVVVTTTSGEHIGMAAQYQLSTDNEANNVWIRAFRKYLNIDMKLAWVSADYDTTMNLAIASGDLPDIFLVNDNQFLQLAEAGLLEDVSGVFDRSLSPLVKSQYDFAKTLLEPYKRNGKLYGLPRLYYGDIDKGSYFWYRKDWMAELGFSGDPKTIDEALRRVEAMNQKYGTKGMAVDKSISELLGLAPMWHAAPRIWIDGSNGTIVYGSVQPEMKTVLTAFADWYKRGLINPNFAIEDSDTVKTDVINGKYGAQPFVQWWGWYAGEDLVKNANKNAYFEPYALPSVDSKPVLTPLAFPNSGTYVVRKGYAHPEALAQLMNFYMLLTYEGVKRNITTDDEFVFYNNLSTATPVYIQPPTVDYNGFYESQKFRASGDYSVFSTAGTADKNRGTRRFLENGDASGGALGGMLQLGSDRTAYGIAAGKVERDEFIRSRIWGPPPEAVARYGSTLDDLLLEGFTQIILGRQPVSYFDTLVKNWYAAGGQEMTNAVNTMYGKK